MAGRAISIDILANVRDALKGTGDVEKALSDVESTLEDMARSGDQSTDKMSRGFRDLARDADQSADKIERSYKDSFRDVARSADDASDDIERSQSRIGERSAEVRDEVRQNLGEGIANAARGDFSSLADTIGDTLGGAVAGIGGIGAAALVAAGAIGLGAVTAELTRQQEEAKRLKERMSDAYQSAASEGRAYIDVAYQISDAQDVMFNPERAEEWKKLQDTQKQTGIDMSVILQANAGDAEALAAVMKRVAEENHKSAESGDEVNVFTEAFGDRLQQLNQYWKDVGKASEEYRDKAKDSLSLTSDLLLKEVDAAKEATIQTDKLGNKLVTLPNGKQIVIDANTGQATDKVEAFTGDVNAIPKEKAVVVKGTVDLSSVRRDIANYRPQITVRANVSDRFGRPLK